MSELSQAMASDQYWIGQAVPETAQLPLSVRVLDRASALAIGLGQAMLELPLYTVDNLDFVDDHLGPGCELDVHMPHGTLKIVEDERTIYKNGRLPRGEYLDYWSGEPVFDTADKFDKKASAMLDHAHLYVGANALASVEISGDGIAVVSRRVIHARKSASGKQLVGYTRYPTSSEESEGAYKFRSVVMARHIVGQNRVRETRRFVRQRRVIAAAELTPRSLKLGPYS